MSEQPQARRTPREEAPYLWLSRAALTSIRDGIGQIKGASAVAVYVALCDLASKNASPTLTAPIAAIAQRAALGYSATAIALISLEQIGVIHIARQGKAHDSKQERLPSIYTLLTTTRPSAINKQPVARSSTKPFVERDGLPFTESKKELPKVVSKEKQREAALSAPPLALAAQGGAGAAQPLPVNVNVW